MKLRPYASSDDPALHLTPYDAHRATNDNDHPTEGRLMRSIDGPSNNSTSPRAPISAAGPADSRSMLGEVDDDLRTGARALFIGLPSIANPTEEDMHRSFQRTMERARALTEVEIGEAVDPGTSSARTLPTGLGNQHYRATQKRRAFSRRTWLPVLVVILAAATTAILGLANSGATTLTDRLVAAVPPTVAVVAGVLGWFVGHGLGGRRIDRDYCQERVRRGAEWQRDALVQNCVSVLTAEFVRAEASSNTSREEQSRERALRVVELADRDLRRECADESKPTPLCTRVREGDRRRRLRGFMRGAQRARASATSGRMRSSNEQWMAG